jgi:hypothetical protein
MLVKELVKILNDMDGESQIMVVKQEGCEYQSIFNISYVNEKHPIGGVTLHLSSSSTDEVKANQEVKC